MLQQIEDKFMAVRKTLSQESRNRYESIEQLKSSLENDMPRLQELITTETDQREQRDQAVFAKIDHEVRICVDAVEQERKQREEAEEAMLEMIKDMTEKIKHLIGHTIQSYQLIDNDISIDELMLEITPLAQTIDQRKEYDCKFICKALDYKKFLYDQRKREKFCFELFFFLIFSLKGDEIKNKIDFLDLPLCCTLE